MIFRASSGRLWSSMQRSSRARTVLCLLGATQHAWPRLTSERLPAFPDRTQSVRARYGPTDVPHWTRTPRTNVSPFLHFTSFASLSVNPWSHFTPSDSAFPVRASSNFTSVWQKVELWNTDLMGMGPSSNKCLTTRNKKLVELK